MNDIDVTEFVKQLKGMVEYDSESKKHWAGYKIVTNSDMKIMCSHYYGREYDLMTNTQKTQVRMDVFKMLRGGEEDG